MPYAAIEIPKDDIFSKVGDFEIEIKMDSSDTENFQGAGLFLGGDSFNHRYPDFCKVGHFGARDAADNIKVWDVYDAVDDGEDCTEYEPGCLDNRHAIAGPWQQWRARDVSGVFSDQGRYRVRKEAVDEDDVAGQDLRFYREIGT